MHDIQRATAIMLLSTLVLTIMQASVRHLSQEIHPFQIVFLRSLLGCVVLIPVALHRSNCSFATRRIGLQVLRACLIGFSMTLFFFGLSVVPLAQASALSLLGILFGSAGAMLFLQEKLRLVNILSFILGLVGALMIIQPGNIEFSWGSYLIILSAASWGASLVVVKALSRTESVLSILTWTTVLLTPLTAFAAVPVWQPPNLSGWLWVSMIAGFSLLGHGLMTKALQLADATVVLPISFTRLIWAGILGLLFFSEVPNPWTILGSAIIVCGVLLTTINKNVAQPSASR